MQEFKQERNIPVALYRLAHYLMTADDLLPLWGREQKQPNLPKSNEYLEEKNKIQYNFIKNQKKATSVQLSG